MARRRTEIRSHRGGVVTRVIPELLSEQQLSGARNAREVKVGSASRRGGSIRLHGAALGSSGPFQGAIQWTAPGGQEVVSVRNGTLYSGSTLRATGLSSDRVSFAVHRLAAVPTLYGADGAKLWRYDGTAATEVLGPPSMDRILVYYSRLFGIKDSNLHYSAVDNPEDFSVVNDGGLAKIETYDTEPLQNMTVLGSSILLFKEDNISRFTGYSKYDIDIDTGTDGVSDEVGLIAPETLVRVEDVAFFLSDRGPYFATTGGVQEVGFNVETVFDFDDRETWSKAVAVHNRRRREIWLCLPGAGSSVNDLVWVLNYRTMTWWGPWDFPFSISAACRYEGSNGVESVLLAGDDGFLRDGDFSAATIYDDIAFGETQGKVVPFSVSYSPLLLDFNVPKVSGPTWHVRADLGTDGSLVCDVENEFGDTFSSNPIPTTGDGVRDYEFRPHYRGKELTVTLSDYSASPVQINSLQADLNVGSDVS